LSADTATQRKLVPAPERGAQALAGLISAALAARICFALLYSPAEAQDSARYLRFAEQIRAFDFTAYDGARTPVYPLFLALLPENRHAIWLAQSALGIATTVLLYLLVASCTGSVRLGLIAGLLHALCLNHIALESLVSTEALATCLIVLAVWRAHKLQLGPVRGRQLVLVGLVCAAAALTRPMCVVLGVAVLLFLMFVDVPRRLTAACVFASAFAAPLVLWAAFNERTVNYFGLSTLMGYNLTQHSGAFIENAPAEYSTLRDIYLKHRERNIAEKHTHSMTIWRAMDEMKRATGLNDAELSRRLGKMSITLFARYPRLYLHSVVRSWAFFWAVPTDWQPELARVPDAETALGVLWWAQAWAFRMAYALFLVIALPVVWWAVTHGRTRSNPSLTAGLMVTTVLLSSFIQALFEYGENQRYALPTQSLALAALVVGLWESRRKLAALFRRPSPLEGAPAGQAARNTHTRNASRTR
jgi:4-amino-4-deoxy-L-arabinose transferase-like glycosyltransferase